MQPIIEKRVICITNDPILSAIISSYFSDEGKYFAIFSLPIENKDETLMHKIFAEYHTVFINNRIVSLQPEHIVFAGLNDYQKKLLDDIPAEHIIEIKDQEEVEQKLSKYANFSGTIECKKSDILSALYISKKYKKKIIISENAKEIEIQDQEKPDGLIVIEKEIEINTVTAINYAYSVYADIKFIKKPEEQEIESINKGLIEGKTQKDEELIESLRKKIISKLPNLDFRKFRYISFFTEGIPYGFALKNCVPISHIMTKMATYFLYDNIFLEESKNFYNTATVFSIEEFEKEETPGIIKLLMDHKYFVLPLTGNKATTENFDNFVGMFPYDILHISSHGGGINGGYYVIKKFKDRKNEEHTFEFYEVPTFSPTRLIGSDGKPKIGVTSKYIFERFDGLKWRSKELEEKKIPKYVWDDMSELVTKSDVTTNVVNRILVKGPIDTTCHIQCSDGQHQGNFHYIAGQHNPFIFNNTCSSWFEIADSFMSSGARAYIGTLWNIKNKNAVNGATWFYKYAIRQKKTIINSFHRTSKKMSGTVDESIYILWGLHFSKLPNPEKLGDKFSKIISSLTLIHDTSVRFLKNKKDSKGSEDMAKMRILFTRKILSILMKKR